MKLVTTEAFPFDTWGSIVGDVDNEGVSAVLVSVADNTGFLVLTKEGDVEYDTWDEKHQEVADYLARFVVDWS